MEKYINNSTRGALFLVPALLLAGFFLLLPPGTAQAVVIEEDISKTAGSLEIPAETTVNGNVSLNFGDLLVNGAVNGNLSSNIGQVIVNGDVNGDVEANMGEIVIAGNVSGDVRAHMGEVRVDGSVGGNVEADLGATRIDGIVGGDVSSGFGELTVDGIVAGDVRSRGGLVVVNGTVQGDVVLERGVVRLGPGSLVSGRVLVERGRVERSQTAEVGLVEITEGETGDEGVNRDPGFHFRGVEGGLGEMFARGIGEAIAAIRSRADWFYRTLWFGGWSFMPIGIPAFFSGVSGSAFNLLIMFALAVLTYTLFPGQVKSAATAIYENPGAVIGWGLLATVLSLPLAVFLAITLVGIPLILVLALLLAVAYLLGYTAITGLIGEKVLGAASFRTANPLGSIAIGAMIIGLIGLIPLFGGLASLGVFALAIGTALATRFGTPPAPAGKGFAPPASQDSPGRGDLPPGRPEAAEEGDALPPEPEEPPTPD